MPLIVNVGCTEESTLPAFGRKSSVQLITAEGEADRGDLVVVRDESLGGTDNLPPPEVVAREIVEDLEAAFAEFAAIAESLGGRGTSAKK